MIFLDFETDGIESRPKYPPKPVGLAYAIDEQPGKYLAWGHPVKNNSVPRDGAAILEKAFRGDYGPCVFHYCIFDIDVAMTHFNLPFPKAYHDTLFLAFLDDPCAPALKLKELAAKYLHRRAGERDALYDWISANVRVNGRKVPKSQLGAHICDAPGDLVGKYASADIVMTRGLFEKLYPLIKQRGMLPAYEREIAVVPITLEMERTGLRVDEPGLKKLSGALEQLVDGFDTRIRKALHVPETFNVDSGDQLGEALVQRKLLTRPTLTPGGKQSTAKDTLIDTCNDPKLVKLLSVRSVADKYLTGFVRPWIEKAAKTGGYIQPRFNQVNRGEDGGARSGRFSSADPNFQNIPSNVKDSPNVDTLLLLIEALVGIGFEGFIGLRNYFLADPGKIWAAIDYSQQELRFLAHFEGGPLLAQYLRDPTMDVHKWVLELIKRKLGIEYPRKFIKTCVFMLIYGGGGKALARKLKVDIKLAYQLRNAVLDALPGVKTLMQTTKSRITTWGGRIYEVEDPVFITSGPDDDAELMTFEYKQLNRRIQGSAADYTKQGMLNVHRALPECRIAVQVHDELGIMVNDEEQARIAADAMCEAQLGVPMLADIKLSRTTWARAA
jgi:DNA polymerase-1